MQLGVSELLASIPKSQADPPKNGFSWYTYNTTTIPLLPMVEKVPQCFFSVSLDVISVMCDGKSLLKADSIQFCFINGT